MLPSAARKLLSLDPDSAKGRLAASDALLATDMIEEAAKAV